MKKLFALFVLITNFSSLFAQIENRYINVVGVSEIVIPGSQIKFSIDIKNVGSTTEESKKLNDEAINKLMEILKQPDSDVNEIEVAPMSFEKNYVFDCNTSRQEGFYTYCTITFLLKDMTKYRDLLTQLSGQSDFELMNSSYQILNAQSYNQQAYESALLAAKTKAEYIAKGMDVKLGKVIEIDENNSSQGCPLSAQEDMMTTEMSGKVTIKRYVRVMFEIVD